MHLFSEGGGAVQQWLACWECRTAVNGVACAGDGAGGEAHAAEGCTEGGIPQVPARSAVLHSVSAPGLVFHGDCSITDA
jgi:hypothetical protein